MKLKGFIKASSMEGNTVLTMFSGKSHFQIPLQLGYRCIKKLAAALDRKNRF